MKISSIWKPSKVEFQSIVDKENSLKNVIEHLGLSCSSGNYVTLHRRISKEKIDLSSLKKNQVEFRRKTGKVHNPVRFSNDNVFVRNSSYGRKHLKKRILEQNLIPYKCKKCNNSGNWLNEKLILVLDHKNGINNDNRLENLRFLCPNCNSQTPTFSGRNQKGKV